MRSGLAAWRSPRVDKFIVLAGDCRWERVKCILGFTVARRHRAIFLRFSHCDLIGRRPKLSISSGCEQREWNITVPEKSTSCSNIVRDTNGMSWRETAAGRSNTSKKALLSCAVSIKMQPRVTNAIILYERYSHSCNCAALARALRFHNLAIFMCAFRSMTCRRARERPERCLSTRQVFDLCRMRFDYSCVCTRTPACMLIAAALAQPECNPLDLFAARVA